MKLFLLFIMFFYMPSALTVVDIAFDATLIDSSKSDKLDQYDITSEFDLFEEIANNVGLLSVPGYGDTATSTGFFISDKLFVTDFLTVDNLRRSTSVPMIIWVGSSYFKVKKIKAISGIYNLAVLETEGGGRGLKLSESYSDVKPGAKWYAPRFRKNIINLWSVEYNRVHNRYSTIQSKHGTVNRSQYLNTIQHLYYVTATYHQRITGHHFVYVNKDHKAETLLPFSGFPILDRRGEVMAVQMTMSNDLIYNNNLIYTIPVRYLKRMLNGKGNCDQMSIPDCLDQAVSEIENETENQISQAQYMFSKRLLTSSYLHEALLQNNKAMKGLKDSAEKGHILSQLQLVSFLDSKKNCFDIDNSSDKHTSLIDTAFKAFNFIGGLLLDEEREKQEMVHWLDQMIRQDFSLGYYLKGLMILNERCLVGDNYFAEDSVEYLKKAESMGLLHSGTLLNSIVL